MRKTRVKKHRRIRNGKPVIVRSHLRKLKTKQSSLTDFIGEKKRLAKKIKPKKKKIEIRGKWTKFKTYYKDEIYDLVTQEDDIWKIMKKYNRITDFENNLFRLVRDRKWKESEQDIQNQAIELHTKYRLLRGEMDKILDEAIEKRVDKLLELTDSELYDLLISEHIIGDVAPTPDQVAKKEFSKK
jgi:hypothetical protein